MKFLFERLTEPEPGATQTQVFNLLDAIQDNVLRITASLRTPADEEEPSVLSFGLPSPVELHKDSAIDQRRCAERLQELITHYEPRLRDVQIAIEKTGNVLQPFRLVVKAKLRGEDKVTDVRFPIELAMR